MKEGTQLFKVDPLGKSYKLLKFEIVDTFGAKRTYMNHIYLLENHPTIMEKRLPSPNSSKTKPLKQKKTNSG